MSTKHNGCQHQVLQLDSSPFAELGGYAQPAIKLRAAATTTSGRVPKIPVTDSFSTFPAPLVLPHDDLNYDPNCPAQSVKSWLQEKARNKVLPEHSRDTIYVGHIPQIGEEVRYMRDWTMPASVSAVEDDGASPNSDLIMSYLKAFYHGMNVKFLDSPLRWTTWDKTSQPCRQVALPKYVALAYGNQSTRIRVRRSPDGAFAAQLNLDDTTDAAIAMLPLDAYALVLLVDHDIHENDDDDFCCGRAYGGSRVAVVQAARYRPSLDVHEKIDYTHMWPLSHCKAFVDGLCAVEDLKPQRPTKRQLEASRGGPMRQAVDAAMATKPYSDPQQASSALWFSRVARTVSHELGHCFGIAHCVYYACNMQGTAGMSEDVRQPPYLCSICEAKVGHAIICELHSGKDEDKRVWARERHEALRVFCEELRASDMHTSMWQGLDAWLAARLAAF
ncbi:hypothetical protein DE146DRAFT_459814 [Phaeosphaeria sp. MPI-PUGE-AT-0046c]|nr:hypothetical protein DE146DRAFT_459814 [Phaeosphaeria sp. MPI-PUGE-AT-0046c]